MTLQIQLSPETEAKLRERSASTGQRPDVYVLRLLQEDLAADDETPWPSQPVHLSAAQRLIELRAWASSHAPLPYEADDSRESIYEGRGE